MQGRALRAELGRSWCARSAAMFRTIGLQLGYRYEDSPIVVPDGTPPVPDDPENFVASARPGSRAPHVALKDGRSMLDLYGRGFVLARFGAGAPDGAAIAEAADEARRAAAHRHDRRCRGRRDLRAAAGAGAARRPRRLARRHARPPIRSL